MENLSEMKKYAEDIRRDVFEMIIGIGGGHFGGAYSCVEILLTIYDKVLTENDKFILSKAHASATLYSILSRNNIIDKELLKTYGKDGSCLGVHAERYLVPGIEFSCGSLGHGLSYGAGLAFAKKLKKEQGRIYVLIGDGESQEGSIWEAAMFSAQHKLDNLITIIDYNKIQSMGRIENILNLEPFVDKWNSFGWKVFEVDGHDFISLKKVFDNARRFRGKPITILAHTKKGRGLSLIENKSDCHYYRPNEKEILIAREELKL